MNTLYLNFRYLQVRYYSLLMRKTIARKDYHIFIKNLIQARKKVGLKQTDVARKLARYQSYVSRVESGEYRIDVMEARDFCKLYKVKLDDLF